MLAHEHGEHRGQQHEDQRLHEAYQHFQQVERNRQKPTRLGTILDIASNMFSPAKTFP